MTAGPDDFSEIPPTDFDDIENQDEEDEIFGRSEPKPELPANEEP